jgi:molybdate transport system regulatory protein
MPRSPASTSLQLRVKFGGLSAFGPGKAELLEGIAATGSIAGAARRMRMSYRRAWKLVDDMNRSFRRPLVSTAAGGVLGGGAGLTATGVQVLRSYRALQRSASVAARSELSRLARLALLHSKAR